jgi:protein-tyrosine phosphatase
MTDVLVLCTANVCRSPMAEALLTRQLRALAAPVSVRSAGMLPGGEPPATEVISVMAGYGLDVSSHRSRRVTARDLDRADLTVAMARANLRHAVVLAPTAWPRAFTLKELLRRGEAIGARAPGEDLGRWLARAHRGRSQAALLGDCDDDDVADPTGGPPRAYGETAAALSDLLGRLVDLCWGIALAGE